MRGQGYALLMKGDGTKPEPVVGKILKTENSEGQLYKKHYEDAGYDVKSSVDMFIEPGGSALVPTGLHIQIPQGYVAILKSRSGLSAKNDVEVGAGVVDSNYRGEIKVKLYCHGKYGFSIKRGDRIAQLLVIPVALGVFEEVDSLEDSDRGANGHGSTGIK